jgi:hypothetical protein
LHRWPRDRFYRHFVSNLRFLLPSMEHNSRRRSEREWGQPTLFTLVRSPMGLLLDLIDQIKGRNVGVWEIEFVQTVNKRPMFNELSGLLLSPGYAVGGTVLKGGGCQSFLNHRYFWRDTVVRFRISQTIASIPWFFSVDGVNSGVGEMRKLSSKQLSRLIYDQRWLFWWGLLRIIWKWAVAGTGARQCYGNPIDQRLLSISQGTIWRWRGAGLTDRMTAIAHRKKCWMCVQGWGDVRESSDRDFALSRYEAIRAALSWSVSIWCRWFVPFPSQYHKNDKRWRFRKPFWWC